MNADYDEAKNLLLKAKRLSPKNLAIDQALQKLEGRLKIDCINEQDLYRKMASMFTKTVNKK